MEENNMRNCVVRTFWGSVYSTLEEKLKDGWTVKMGNPILNKDGSTECIEYILEKKEEVIDKPKKDHFINIEEGKIDMPLFNNRADAERVLDKLFEFVENYGHVTMADLYDMSGITSSISEHKYGWIDISDACILRFRNGFIIKLPKLVKLKEEK